jgi:hypothetical protein
MLIDSRGNLFGRINIVDAAVVAFVAALLPLSYAAYRVFRIPPPEIVGVTPATLTPEMPRRLRLTGHHFRPYLGAFVAKNGAPFSLNRRLPIDSQQATFLIETPNEVEIDLPPVEPGLYDIRLYDEALEVASHLAAFTVAPVPRVTVEALVRFVVPPALAPVVKEGDRDRWESAGNVVPPGERATIASVRVTQDQVQFFTARTPSEGSRLTVPDVALQTPGVAVAATVRIPARARVLGGWEYKGDWLRAGETLLFETDRYRMFGVIERVTEMTDPAQPGGGK